MGKLRYPNVNSKDIVGYYKNHSMQDCADKFGLSQTGVKYRLVDYGIKIRKAGETSKLTGRLKVPHNRMDKNPAWKGGKHINNKGYIVVIIPASSGRSKYSLEHRLIWQEHFGKIPKGYVIHHINGIKTDNRIDNLICMKSKSHDNLIPLLQTKICELERKLGI